MAEGTSLGLYILIGAIIFGVFVLIVALFGPYIRSFLQKTFSDSTDKVGSNLSSALADF